MSYAQTLKFGIALAPVYGWETLVRQAVTVAHIFGGRYSGVCFLLHAWRGFWGEPMNFKRGVAGNNYARVGAVTEKCADWRSVALIVLAMIGLTG